MKNILRVIFKKVNLQAQFLFFFIILYFANIFRVQRVEWLILIVTFTIVIVLEMVSYLAKEMTELYSLDKNLHVKRIEDIADGTVLLACLALLVVIVIIFLPYLKF